MSTARDAAPEVDRLVLSVNRSHDEDRIRRAAADVGLDSLDLLLHWWDFLLAGRLTPEIATLRSRYRPEEQIRARLEDLAEGGHLEETPTGLAATEALRPVLDALADEFTTCARTAWRGRDDAVATATVAADQLAARATDEHVVAAVHRSLPRPADPYGGLHHRLITLRFIRQHDHAEAWTGHGMTAAQMVVFTRLWSGEDPREDRGTLDELVERGLVDRQLGELTPDGRKLRQVIEDDTNGRNARTFASLDDGGASFLAAVRSLPSARP